jgi:hypothetical protein
MRTLKSVLGLVAALIPILYCGGLLLYFGGVSRWAGTGGGLGPTMLGLAAIGLVLVTLLAVRIWRMARAPGTPRAGGGGADETAEEERSDFDPDAAIARYMARRAAGGVDLLPPGGGSHRPGGFGRKSA